jgi:hypothetical protein
MDKLIITWVLLSNILIWIGILVEILEKNKTLKG